MEIPIKQSGNFSLPILGLGTWTMGGKWERNPHNDGARDINTIREAIELGITHIDAAESYAAGRAEELVGQAIGDADRENLFITTKVAKWHLAYDDVIEACKNSLERLNTNYVDLYLVHAPNPQIPLKDTTQAMEFLLENEMIRNIGVSNFTKDLIEEAQSYTNYKIVNNQIYYNLGIRGHEVQGTLEYCQKNDILVTAYRPIEKGEFIENELLKELGLKYNKTPLQVALNWVMGKPNMVTLVKTSSSKHLEEDLGAIGWELSKEDEERLNKDFPWKDQIEIE